MNYKFPTINTIDDVLPAIEGRPEFKVTDKKDYLAVNYMVNMSDTFDMTGPDDVHGAIRRECRGIIFYASGKIMSRPFHKFFNIGERPETQPNVLDFSLPHTIMTKMDGSMLRPLLINDKLRWGTKAGCDTDVSNFAEEYIAENPKYSGFAMSCVLKGITPIFEYVGPHNKIVLNYKENMVLLAARNNITGEYMGLK